MKKPTILIVDSDESSILLLEEIIRMMFEETQDYQILSTSSGNRAIPMCYENDTKLIITEINLKEVDGLEVTKKIKAFCPSIPVIIQTAFITDDTEKQVFSAGADNFVAKPIDTNVMRNKISEVMAAPLSERILSQIF
jgi:CheY-like chemotaxis protein